MSGTPTLNIVTGDNVLTRATITSPGLILYGPSGKSSGNVVSDLSKTYIFSDNREYIQFIYSFELLSALLDSAPTNNADQAVLFTISIDIQDK
jgi:hypothetical protein